MRLLEDYWCWWPQKIKGQSKKQTQRSPFSKQPKQPHKNTLSLFLPNSNQLMYQKFTQSISKRWCDHNWTSRSIKVNLQPNKFLSWFHVYPRYFNQANLGYYYQIWPFILLVSCIGSVPWALLFACWQYLVYSFNLIPLEIDNFQRQCSRCTATHKLIIT